VAAARRAFDGWSTTTPTERAQALLALAEKVQGHGAAIAREEALNAGKPLAAVMPHGGFKESGYGKDLSVYSLEDYTVIKHVMASLQ
jgi:acyl-CoA reductase-like NAD-dependent aldehyde dehydrogenase